MELVTGEVDATALESTNRPEQGIPAADVGNTRRKIVRSAGAYVLEELLELVEERRLVSSEPCKNWPQPRVLRHDIVHVEQHGINERRRTRRLTPR